jgi:hypothetical protein
MYHRHRSPVTPHPYSHPDLERRNHSMSEPGPPNSSRPSTYRPLDSRYNYASSSACSPLSLHHPVSSCLAHVVHSRTDSNTSSADRRSQQTHADTFSDPSNNIPQSSTGSTGAADSTAHVRSFSPCSSVSPQYQTMDWIFMDIRLTFTSIVEPGGPIHATPLVGRRAEELFDKLINSPPPPKEPKPSLVKQVPPSVPSPPLPPPSLLSNVHLPDPQRQGPHEAPDWEQERDEAHVWMIRPHRRFLPPPFPTSHNNLPPKGPSAFFYHDPRRRQSRPRRSRCPVRPRSSRHSLESSECGSRRHLELTSYVYWGPVCCR